MERAGKEAAWKLKEVIQDRDFQLKKQQQTFVLRLESISAENDRLKKEIESMMDCEFDRQRLTE